MRIIVIGDYGRDTDPSDRLGKGSDEEAKGKVPQKG
jgi:hypothetical protein